MSPAEPEYAANASVMSPSDVVPASTYENIALKPPMFGVLYVAPSEAIPSACCAAADVDTPLNV